MGFGPPTVDYAALLGRERKRLLELLGTVNPSDWSRQTPCPAWDVADLCRHLLGDDLHLLSTVRDDHQGTEPPTDIDEPSFIDWLDGVQEGWVQASRRISPQLVVDLLRWTGPQITETFRRTDPGAVTQIVSWAADSPVPMWLDMGRELTEYWIHRQQLRQALGRDTDLREDILGPVLDALRWAYPYRLSQLVQQPGDAGQAGDTVIIDVQGTTSRRWSIVRSDDGWGFADRPTGRVVATMRLGTDQAWRLLTNNLPAAEQATLDVEGADPVVTVLRRTRAIIGAPNT